VSGKKSGSKRPYTEGEVCFVNDRYHRKKKQDTWFPRQGTDGLQSPVQGVATAPRTCGQGRGTQRAAIGVRDVREKIANCFPIVPLV